MPKTLFRELFELSAGDRFTFQGQRFELRLTDDADFLATGCLRVRNLKTGQISRLNQNCAVLIPA